MEPDTFGVLAAVPRPQEADLTIYEHTSSDDTDVEYDDTEEDTELVEVEEVGEEENITNEENVVIGSQLTLAVGGAKPKNSILQIAGKQIELGQQQVKHGDVIEGTIRLEIRRVAFDTKKQGVMRSHRAVITNIDLGLNE